MPDYINGRLICCGKTGPKTLEKKQTADVRRICTQNDVPQCAINVQVASQTHTQLHAVMCLESRL